jgi:hypothetical protein
MCPVVLMDTDKAHALPGWLVQYSWFMLNLYICEQEAATCFLSSKLIIFNNTTVLETIISLFSRKCNQGLHQVRKIRMVV